MNELVASGCAIHTCNEKEVWNIPIWMGETRKHFLDVSVKQKHRIFTESIRIETPVTDLARLSW